MSHFFGFVQFEFAHAIGPGEGRYIVQPSDQRSASPAPSPLRRPQGHVEEEALQIEGKRNVSGSTLELGTADVLVINVLHAPRAAGTPRFGRSPKVRAVKSSDDPEAVPVLQVSYVRGTKPMTDKREAARQLEALKDNAERQQQLIDEAFVVVNRAIRGYRAGAHDPYVTEVARRDTRSVRIGYGTTTDVSNGTWEAAIAIPQPNPRRAKRTELLRPAETMAGVLSGRGEVLESEELLIRAMADLDHDRTRAAALQAYSALELMRSEMPDAGAYTKDGVPFEARSETAKRLAGAAVEGPLSADDVEELEDIIEHIELSVESWRFSDSRY